MTLDGMINKYKWMQEELENKKAELEDLKQQIVNKMTEQGVDKFQSTEGNIATLVNRTNYKYNDEASMVAWLKKNRFANMIKEKIVTTALNKELSKQGKITKALNSYYVKDNIKTLSVKSGG